MSVFNIWVNCIMSFIIKETEFRGRFGVFFWFGEGFEKDYLPVISNFFK